MSAILKFSCVSERELQDELSVIKALKGLSTINHALAGAGVEGFLSFDTAEDRDAARAKIESTLKFLDVSGAKKETKKKKQREVPMNVASQLFTYTSAPTVAQQQQDGSGRGRGGQGRGRAQGRGRGRGQGRGRGDFRPRVKMIQGYTAVLDNVPFSMTNDQLAREFSECGQIYDINRLELMAMIYFDSADAVQRAIVARNGQKIKDSIVTVSSGGTVKVPAPLHAEEVHA